MNSVVICFFQYHVREIHCPSVLSQSMSIPQFIYSTIEDDFVYQGLVRKVETTLCIATRRDLI